MNALLVAEYRDGTSLDSYRELIAFARELGAASSMFVVGSAADLPEFDGTLYLADAARYGECSPDVHRALLQAAVERAGADLIVFSHSSYGWDLAPRLAYSLGATQISEVVGSADGAMVVPVCNGKLRRQVRPSTPVTVVTLQAGAFSLSEASGSTPDVVPIDTDTASVFAFEGYEEAESGGVDLSKAEVVVGAGRGIKKPENVALVAALAAALGGEYGASRPVVDAEWVEHNRQVGTTGQTVAPKLYVACGISGAIQHLAGMKKAEFIVAINTDRDAPIGEVADVLVVADLSQFVPVLTDKLEAG